MRPAILNPLFTPVTTLSGVGPKQDKLLRYLLDRSDTPRLVDLLLHLPTGVIDRRARPKIRDAVPGTVVTLADRSPCAGWIPMVEAVGPSNVALGGGAAAGGAGGAAG